MRVPAEGRAGALIADASRGSSIKGQSAGGAAQPSAPLPCRDEPERCRSCSHLAAPFNKCFCLFTAGSHAAWAPGGFVSTVRTGSRVLTPEGEAARPALCDGNSDVSPRGGGERPPLRSGRLAMLNLITLSQSCQRK